jgi:hydrogenase expression/formation protein HypD
MELLYKVFEVDDALWRGIGIIPGTGLSLREQYRKYDGVQHFGVKITDDREYPGCKCGEVLRGVKTPLDCGLYGRACLPEHPVGPCMVSMEGTCAAYYKYGRRNE